MNYQELRLSQTRPLNHTLTVFFLWLDVACCCCCISTRRHVPDCAGALTFSSATTSNVHPVTIRKNCLEKKAAGVNSATTVDYWLNKGSNIATWHVMAVRVFRCYFADLLRNPHTSHRTLITDAAGYPGEFTARSGHRYNDDPPLTFRAFLLQSRLKAFSKDRWIHLIYSAYCHVRIHDYIITKQWARQYRKWQVKIKWQ